MRDGPGAKGGRARVYGGGSMSFGVSRSTKSAGGGTGMHTPGVGAAGVGPRWVAVVGALTLVPDRVHFNFPTPWFYPLWMTVTVPELSDKRVRGVLVHVTTMGTTARTMPGTLFTLYGVVLPVTMVRGYGPVNAPVCDGIFTGTPQGLYSIKIPFEVSG